MYGYKFNQVQKYFKKFKPKLHTYVFQFINYSQILSLQGPAIVTRYVGLGIRRVRSWITVPGSLVSRAMDRNQQFFDGSGIRLYIFVGSGTKICHSFGTKDQKFRYKNGISDEKHTSLRLCL